MVAAVVDHRPELAEVTDDNRLRLNFHEGQLRAWDSEKRWIVVLAGTQSGKTSFGPHWLAREIKRKGPGDYVVVTPTFQLLELKALPEFKRLFEEQLQLGKYQSSPVRKFVFTDEAEERWFGAKQDVPTQVFFGYAEDPDSLESATYKGGWLDEAGQKKFKLGSWRALRRRFSLNRGRALLTTTPYDIGWLKQTFWDPWVASGQNHPDIDIINFPSTANPNFPLEELEQARIDLPAWQFEMFYLGRFKRPAGLIYNCFDDAIEGQHVIKPFTIPPEWPRFQGADFGGVNTAGVWVAQALDKDGNKLKRFYVYREYLAGGKTARQHADTWAGYPEGRPKRVVGGSKSEDQWRAEFRQSGYPISEPDVSEVEVGINRLYGGFARDEVMVFSSCTGIREQLTTYSRVLDSNGDPTEAIEDKASFHYLDAARYIFGWLYRTPRKMELL